MWTGPPKSLHEYMTRRALMPWIVAGVIVLIMGACILSTAVAGRNPLRRFAVASPGDKIITTAVAGLVGAIALAYAPLGARKARHLAARGQRTTGRLISASTIGMLGSKPVTVEYTVGSTTYRLKRDMRVEQIAALRGSPVHLIYDPQKPGDAMVLPPAIARLPEK
jgi:hypothetical protein